MSLHRLDPLWVDHPAPEHPARFVLQVADPGTGRVGAVAKKLSRVAAGQGPHGGNHAAVVLHVVITVEYVVLPGVLVLSGHHDLAEPLPELRPGANPEVSLGVGVAAPSGVNLGQVLHRFPVPFVQSRQNTGPISARFATEYPIQGRGPDSSVRLPSPRGRGAGSDGIGSTLAHVFLKVFKNIVFFGRFVLGCRQLHGLIQKIDKVGEGVTEKTADPYGYVDAGVSQFGDGYNLQALDSTAFRLPDRPDAQQCENLGNVIAVGAHRRRSPDHKSHHFRISPFFCQVLFQQSVSQGFAGFPGGWRWYGLGVHRIKVTTRGQNVGHPPGGRSAGSRRHEPAVQSPKQVADLIRGTLQGRIDRIRHVTQHVLGLRVSLSQDLGHHRVHEIWIEILGQQQPVGFTAQRLYALQQISLTAHRRVRICRY